MTDQPIPDRATVDRLRAALDRVLDLHQELSPGGYCHGCRETPCPTREAIGEVP